MASVNKVILIGNLTRDPELKHTPKGTAVAEIGLAINRKFRDPKSDEWRDETTFVDVTFWGKPGETVAKYLSKGSPLYLEGRLQLDTWEDKASGKKRSKLRVVGENFQFLGGGSDSQSRSTRQEQRTAPARQQDASDDDDDQDDIPF